MDPVRNFLRQVLTLGYTSGATNISVPLISQFPPISEGQFNLVWWNITDFPDPTDDPNAEIVRVTGISGSILTILRAQEGTLATNKNLAGKQYAVALVPTKKTIDDIRTALDGKQDSLAFTPENVANKSTDIVTDQASDTKYPSVKAVFDWVSGAISGIIGSLGALSTKNTVGTNDIDDDAVTFAKIQQIQNNHLLGRNSPSSGDVEEIQIAGGLELSGTNIRRQALTGDVTAPAGDNATTIANGVVTNAKLANVGTSTIKGRVTAGNGAVQDLSVAQARTLLLVDNENVTGAVISFIRPQIYNSPASPETGNITDNLTNASVGVVQKIYHNHSSAPTFPAGWVLIGGSYSTNELNVIFAEWVSSTRVEYWIAQEQ